MIPIRLSLVAQRLSTRRFPQCKTRIRNPVAMGSRAYFPPRTSTPSAPAKRVQILQSRVLSHGQAYLSGHCILPLRIHSLSQRYASSTPKPSDITFLHSAFPAKTTIFLAIVGTVAYFFLDVKLNDWTDNVLDAYHGDHVAMPLHFYRDREEVDHWIQHHLPDPSTPMRDSQFMENVSNNFDKLASGWMMNEDDAKEAEMPVTHGCRFRSNEPCEDFHALGTAPGPGSHPWNFWAVYDGHAGRHTAMWLQWNLIPHLSRALSNLAATSPPPVIESTITQTFVKLDDDLMARAKHAGNWFPAANAAAIAALSPALSGSCALLAAFDPQASKLRVACTGDSRAVLGRWDPLESKYITQPLSADQTGFNQAEVDRIMGEHPDEPDIIDPKSGRLMGIAVTRAFGDHRWKWDSDFIKQVQFKFWGTAPRPGTKSAPYMTAEPVVTETDVIRADPKLKIGGEAGKSDFMIMASDGLWDKISSEHAVECVQRWLEAKERGSGSVSKDPQLQHPIFPDNFQLDPGVTYDVEKDKEITWKATPEYFAIEDENAAVCLARNAMGGTRRGLFLGVLSVPGPLCRYAVDDTTIMVVFFDKLGAEDGGKAKEKRRSWWPW